MVLANPKMVLGDPKVVPGGAKVVLGYLKVVLVLATVSPVRFGRCSRSGQPGTEMHVGRACVVVRVAAQRV